MKSPQLQASTGGGPDIPLLEKHEILRVAGWFVGGEYPYRNPATGGLFYLEDAWNIYWPEWARLEDT